MDRSRRILDALGAEGLERMLRGVLDRPTLVRVANACRVSYPGKRAQTVPAGTLMADIAKKAAENPESGAALVKALEKACAAEIRETAALDEEDLLRLAAAPPPAARRGGALLFALAADPREHAHTAVQRLLSHLKSVDGAPAGSSAPAADGVLRDEIARMRERLARMEEDLSAAQRAAAASKREAEEASGNLLISRKHAHTLEGRINRLLEDDARLQERNLYLSGRLEALERGALAGESLSALSSEVHRALRENQKALHEIRELVGTRLASPPDPARPYLEALASTVRAVQSEIADLRREREADRRKEREVISDLAREAHSIRTELAGVRSAEAARPARRKGEPDRVGLFVDVQNMYYAARQLNARLDFGALIEAVSRDRRLIRATAYVVQNRDIDQTGFLAMLQQRNYEIRRKDLKVRADGSSKGDWDMEMAFEMLDLAESLDVVVLASGDGDFVSLVNRIKTKGPMVEVYSFPGSTAKELIEACDRHVPIDEGLLIRMSPTA